MEETWESWESEQRYAVHHYNCLQDKLYLICDKVSIVDAPPFLLALLYCTKFVECNRAPWVRRTVERVGHVQRFNPIVAYAYIAACQTSGTSPSENEFADLVQVHYPDPETHVWAYTCLNKKEDSVVLAPSPDMVMPCVRTMETTPCQPTLVIKDGAHRMADLFRDHYRRVCHTVMMGAAAD